MAIRGFSLLSTSLLLFFSCVYTVSSTPDIFLRTQNATTTTTTTEENPNYYSIDGSNNNLNVPSWGQIKTARVRHLPNASRYYDEIAPNVGGEIPVDETNFDLPSARRIMEELFSQATPEADKGTNHLMLEFGHFIVQDVIGRTLMNESEPFPMPCDGEVRDVVFCPVTGKNYSIPFDRSQSTFTSETAPRASLNGETAFMDMSNMYGNTPEVQKEVREFVGGRVLLDENRLPPILDKYNSSPGVFSLYVVFLRYHNILAEQFATEDPSLSDEELFQMARHKNIAIYQFNAEEKYIPTLLGSKLKTYEAYDPSVDPSIDEFFAAASFRYAHSSFSGLVRLLDENFDPTSSDPLILRDVFRRPSPNNVPRVVRMHGGVEPFLRGLTITNAKSVDLSMVQDINYFTEATSLLDIQRGRDMGLPSYNAAREAFNLTTAKDFEALVGYDYLGILSPLKELYNDTIDNLDAYVGALVEEKDPGAEMGPLFSESIKNQFERIRDGDRFWYRNRYTQEEWEQFPSMADLIRATCEQMDNLPSESFLAWDGVVTAEEGSCGASSQLSLIDGKFSLGWQIEIPTTAELRAQPDLKSTIEVTMVFNERMNSPGYMGVGWRSQVMNGAEIWFCTTDSDVFGTESFPDSCDAESGKVNFEKKLFSCCISQGGLHIQPECSNADASAYYELTVTDWCLTPGTSRVTVMAPVCADNEVFADGKVNCFRTASKSNGEMEFIVAYNPNRIGNHGYQMRTAAAVDLSAGVLTQGESNVADTGLIATHAIFMLFGWCVMAPLAIFIVRYMKTRSWRLVAHVSLMGVIGSMMVPLLIGVEASVGATDKTQEHSAVGLALLGVYFVMVFAGRVKYLKLQGKKVGRKTYYVSRKMHKYGGVIMVMLAWFNCFTGLQRISPEDSYIQVILFSSFPLGYDLPIFGYIQQYVFFPYLGCVCLIFIIAEFRRRRLNGSGHAKRLQKILEGKSSIWDDDTDKFLERMTMSSFMEATKLGTALCIVDGYVLDITSFVENHPGGQHLLRYAAGSDITEEFVGKRDVDGLRHVHSHSAVQLMKTFVKAVLVDDDNKKLSFSKGASSRAALAHGGGGAFKRMSLMESIARVPENRRGASVFRRGRVVGIRYLTPEIEITHTSKPVILLQLALPKTRNDLHVQKLISLPSCAFTFRGIGKNNDAVDRQYTPVKIHNDYDGGTKSHGDEEVFDFIISLVPGGKMSKILLDARIGKTLLAQGPTVNQETVATFRQGGWRSVIMIAAGTGVSPMLQVIDYYIGKLSSEFYGVAGRLDSEVPNMYLMWIVKSPKYNYSDTLALDARVAKSNGKFKYMVIYTTSQGKKEPVDNPRQNLKHQWTFKDIVDKTMPKKNLPGMKKPKKVKREVIDAANKMKKGQTFQRLPGKSAPGWRSSKFESKSFNGSRASASSSGEFSIHNEITEYTWEGEDVQTCYRSYSKMLLEELLLSIPRGESAELVRPRARVSPTGMPSIFEEDSDEFSSKDGFSRSSDDLSSSSRDDVGSRGDYSSIADSRSSGDYLSTIQEGSSDEEDTIPTPDAASANDSSTLGTGKGTDKGSEKTAETVGSGSSPDSIPMAEVGADFLTSRMPSLGQGSDKPRSSWLPPTGPRLSPMTAITNSVVRSLDEAKNASYAREDDYVSFDHKQLKKGFSTAPSGTVFIRSPPPTPAEPKPPAPKEKSNKPPPSVPARTPSPPVPSTISAPSVELSSSPKPEIKNAVDRTPSWKAQKAEDRTPSSSSNATPDEEPAKKSILKKTGAPPNPPRAPRPVMEERRPSKTLEGASSSSRPMLSKPDVRVEELLNQLEIQEEEYRDRKMLVAISGAPMFEYKTRLNLGDLGFPKENMVTFHASAQQL